MKPEAIQENFKQYQENVQKFTETFFNGIKK